VEYRWSIFERYLAVVPKGAPVLDFGAGSLRDTYEMAVRGFQVVSLDLDRPTLNSYYADFDWNCVPNKPEIFVGGIDQLRAKRFAVVTAFDVFEHLENPKGLLAQMRELLYDQGLVFCTVPNKRTIFEITFRINWKLGLAMGRKFTPGEPHIQFKSPEEWHAFFEDRTGFKVMEHGMAIGFFVNSWAALLSVPKRVLCRILRKPFQGSKADPDALGYFGSPRVMSALNQVDRRTEKAFRGLYGLNLIVLQRA
jgi:2-polyprenyl-3-methyl-5-hydroxy-6-metoxy-1,4-benzoquinol methylase